MTVSRKKSKDTTTLVFDGELTIYTVSQLKDALFAEPEVSSAKVALDLQSVSELDTAGVQLLLFIRQFFSAVAKEVVLAKTNELVDAVFSTLDIHSHFARAQ
ncbi:STAS domain-containing protein [Cellvibrio japonicus]|uniref:STAS domain protein n=1 Tax=Cellvibrio japonicus (strain Ueda107) TaxID=498211 RepID=B3PCN7_CELJU|nr:STAS domain-containing protein [Cellvibrio japonicus]ACE85305.1 STAS domain protein [Cellvibrio japonicus Ueda107]QEI13260.1 STAS domain-containing protein [Cellvibrio japonicus]QEI16834.1 STAS domain-containing protein [Cellvibrio japonicus]QEI20412.1 STAS domain-containing protein [Cellvibrio japonicus]